MMNLSRIAPMFLVFATACGDVENPEGEEENEVITTLVLTFTPVAGGDALEFSWADVENDGNPVIDDIALSDADDYDVTVSFLNELEDPAEDITLEIQDEDDEHQIFFTGTAVQGPATGTNASAVVEHAYADSDADGLPVGLDNTFTTLGTGSGELTVTLRHLPPENGEAVKVSGLADTVASDGFGAIGGDNDVQVTFALDVQ